MKYLFFSTSDDSDPNMNGRTYTAILPEVGPEQAAALAASAALTPELAWQAPNRRLRCAVLGMGNRGIALAGLLQSFAGVDLGWICDQSEERLAAAQKRLAAPGLQTTINMCVPIADAAVDIVIVALPDHPHRAAAEPAFEAGKHVFLEKPIATTVADGRAILDAWQRSGKVLRIGYVLRATPFYRAVRNVVRSGMLGPIRVVTATDQLDVLMGASFMRRWHAESANCGGLIVHKGCHDLDAICWLLGARPRTVASFGGASTFARPAPARFCSQCGERATCEFADAGAHENRAPAEWADPTAYELDRCVFGPHKDIVDNQVVAFELDNGVRGSFTLSMQNPSRTERRLTLIGDAGRLDGVLQDGTFTVRFTDPERDPIVWSANGTDSGGHHGGDQGIMIEFLDLCTGRAQPPTDTPEDIMAGLLFAAAAEEARLAGSVVRLRGDDFAINRGS